MVANQEEKFDLRVPRARRLRRDMADAERKLWWHLRHLPIEHSHFRGKRRSVPSSLTLPVMNNASSSTSMARNTIISDEERSAYLRSQGYRILHFCNNDVLKSID